MVDFLQKIWIEVLCAVGKKHHEGHEHNEIEEAFPMSSNRLNYVLHAVGAMLVPRGRFGDFGADVKSEQRGQRAEPEHGPPTPRGQDKTSGNGSEQIPDRVATLQNAAEYAAPARRRRFHGERRADTPLSAHADTEKGAKNQEDGVVGRKAASQLNHGKIDDVGHERNAAAIAIRK